MMLEIDNLHAYYGKSHVLHGVSLGVGTGEIVSLLGRNGSGRSTTILAAMGAVTMSGSIRFKGEELSGLSPHAIARRGLGMVPEARDIFPELTVRQNLVLGMKSARREGRWSIEETFARFPNLRERADIEAGVLSGGEQQMLAICRTLMGDPALVMIDEPTEGLAPKIVQQVAGLITEIAAAGTSVLLVEQKLTIALEIAARVYVMGHGEIVFGGTPDALRADRAVIQEWLEV